MISELLLDVDVAVDLIGRREPHGPVVEKALRLASSEGVRLWLYVGSACRLQAEAAQALAGEGDGAAGPERSDVERRAGEALDELSRSVQWLAALAGEGPVFASGAPHQAQLLKALDRLGPGSRLLTRDAALIERYPEQTLHPETYLREGAGGKRPIPFVDLRTQQDRLRPQIEENLHRVLHHGRYILGPEVQKLEARLAEFTGARHAVGCASGTDALLMGLMACGVAPGQAVLTTPFTFIATAEAIALLGATPVFVDIDPATFTMDPEQLELALQAIRDRDPGRYPLPKPAGTQPLVPKAVLPVDLFGLPADYGRINSLAEAHGLTVIEDAAQSLGAEYGGQMAGSLGHIGCTSFFPAKPLGGYGDGGAVFTDDPDLAGVLHSLKVHGTGDRPYEHVRLGLNARLDSLQAAVLLPKLELLPEELAGRRRIASTYRRLIGQRELPLELPAEPEDRRSAWAQFSVLAPDESARTKLRKRLDQSGVPTAVYYPRPLHMQQAFAHLGYRPEDLPVSLETAGRIFSLPMHPYLDEASLLRIVKALEGSEGA